MASLFDDSQWRWILSVSVGRRIQAVSEDIHRIQPERKIYAKLDTWIQVCLDTHWACLETFEDTRRATLTLLGEFEERS